MYRNRSRLIILFAAGVLLLAACNLPSDQTPEATQGPGPLYTAAAQTVAAQLTQAAAGTAVVIPSATTVPATPLPPTNTALPTNTPLPSNTPVPPTATQVPIPCDRAGFVQDVTYPDNTEVAAGSTFVKTWRLRNNGSCTWTSGYTLIFASGDAMNGPASSQLTTGSVAPGATIDVSVTLTAPTTPGTYRGEWKLRNAAGASFGIGAGGNSNFWVQIKSVNPSTPTPTNTPTPVVTLAFDFISRGPDAQWRNATSPLAWGDPPDDSNGVAVDVSNVRMEDNRTYSRLLATYPQRITDGMILGLYPSYTIQNNDHLRAIIGLRADCGSGRVRFQVRYIEAGVETIMGEWIENCNSALTPVDINLSGMAGRTVQFELVVLSDGSPDNDIALWVSPRIER